MNEGFYYERGVAHNTFLHETSNRFDIEVSILLGVSEIEYSKNRLAAIWPCDFVLVHFHAALASSLFPPLAEYVINP